MKKDFIIAVLMIVIAVLFISVRQMSDRASYWMKRSDAADRYIEELEKDFPSFIDTTSGSDAYSEYYEYK